jgi:allophanate hydrolase subunit 2
MPATKRRYDQHAIVQPDSVMNDRGAHASLSTLIEPHRQPAALRGGADHAVDGNTRNRFRAESREKMRSATWQLRILAHRQGVRFHGSSARHTQRRDGRSLTGAGSECQAGASSGLVQAPGIDVIRIRIETRPTTWIPQPTSREQDLFLPVPLRQYHRDL